MQANTLLTSGRRERRHATALAALTLAMAANPASAQVSVSVAFDASAGVLTATERSNVTSHLQEAGRRWGSVVALSGPRSVEVTVSVGAIATASGASLTSSFIGSIGGRDTFEQGVAAEWRTGVDPNGAAADAGVTFGLAYLRNELWFDPDPHARTAPVPLDRTDAMSVLLHEFGHILAYNGFADVDTGQPPPTFWSIWDRWMIPGQPTLFAGPATVARWGTMPELTTGNINHWGNPAPGIGAALIEPCANTSPQWRDGVPVPRQCPAPGSVAAPASATPDPVQSTMTGGNLLDQLMNGVVFYRGTRYDISALDVAVLEDVGFTVERIFASGFDAP